MHLHFSVLDCQGQDKETHLCSSVTRTVQECMEKYVRQPAQLTASGKLSLFTVLLCNSSIVLQVKNCSL